MRQCFRNPAGGLIDRAQPLTFRFNERVYAGYAGDTLASALLANGVHLVGRSFKYHRPRGILGIGAEEPNALFQLGTGARTEPNSKATQTELFDGLVSASQNCWPTVNFDMGALAGLFSCILPAGFYYKTFMWPPGWWMAYEPFIRRMAGLGRAPRDADPDRYEHSHIHCEVLVVGAGPAGLSAALAAGRSGARVLLVDEGHRPGGSLLHGREEIDGSPALDWVERVQAELASFPNVRVLPRATAFGYYDHNQLGVFERVADHREPRPGEPRQRLWHVRAREVVLATGAHERSLVFANNDLPGILLASAARGYLNRYAVRPGRTAVVFTNNDSAYATAFDLAAGGVEVRALVDVRKRPINDLARRIRDSGIELLAGSAVVEAHGWHRVSGVTVAQGGLNEKRGRAHLVACDLLCVSGGWNPVVHLHAQSRGRPVYDATIDAFVPGPSAQAERSAGAARGTFSLGSCLEEGAIAGAAAAHAAGYGPAPKTDFTAPAREGGELQSAWSLTAPYRRSRKRFVDLQNDVTEADIALAVREGYRSVEHVKRYTTLGMGTDQGKTSNTSGFAHVAARLGVGIESVGTTTYRPPYVPVTLGALAGSEGGHHFQPRRRTPMHDCHLGAGAVMLQAGPWLRPQCYPRRDETLDEAVRRESAAVRNGIGVVDISTLGKFELVGPDAIEFLERVYVNRWRSLKVGRCRYGVMLREDGMVFDDGTTSRLSDTRFFMTTTTAQAQLVARRLAYYLKNFWPELNLRIVNVTEQWAGMALAGRHSRAVLSKLTHDVELGGETLPYMGFSRATVGGVKARIMRISFSGELAYEIYVPAGYGPQLWQKLLDAGSEYGITPYGIDAMNTLRIEKGHVAGTELDGRVTADDLGLGNMIRPEGDFIGRRSLSRPALRDPGRWQLVGLVPEDRVTPLPPGAKILNAAPNRYLGDLTSTAWSPSLDMPIGLALVSGGRQRHGERLLAASPLGGRHVPVTVRSPVFFDPEGSRLHG